MNEIEKMILAECHRQQVEIAETEPPPAWRKWDVREYEDLVAYGPRFSSAAWFADKDGRIPERWRTRILRTVWSLHDAGMIIATKTGSRLSHIRLTDSGRNALEESNDERP